MTDPRLNNREMITILINEASTMPALWLKKNKDYLNRNVKTECFQRMADVMKDTIPEATPQLARAKWNNLKASYIRQKNEIAASRRTGAGMQEGKLRLPTLWYYHLMMFLDEDLDNRPVVNSIENDSVPSSDCEESHPEAGALDVEVDGDTYPAEETTLLSRGRKRKRFLNNANARKQKKDSLLDMAPWLFKKKTSTVNESFGEYIGKELDDIDPSQAAIARKLISDVLFNARQSTLC